MSALNKDRVTCSCLTRWWSPKNQSLSTYYSFHTLLVSFASNFCISLLICVTTAALSFSLLSLPCSPLHSAAKNLINLICTHPFSRISSVKQEEQEIDFTINRSRRHKESLCVTTLVPFFLISEEVQKTFGFDSGKLRSHNFPEIWLVSHAFLNLFSIRVCRCLNVLDIPVLGCGFQSYSGHPRISLFLLFSVSSHLMRGSKYSMSGWALILGWPVIRVMASGQGLLKPRLITSLQTLTQFREEGQRARGSARVCGRDNYPHGEKHVFTSSLH